ncbi:MULTISPECIES: hypothetical protein [Streptomyces]|uniref:Uncharacterized protein n=1 Tax=Streptomyces cadmiisoli TaxID=2184053 RepID=A0A2Z4J8V3_9ACTN|nr:MULTISPECIES: hypothetical protein [Streptomyces]AWW41551.1 hypothetical protein DN051_36850 [Streptomyces cadmiisoli]KOV74785.1 hypothetical protein ADL00_00225 [Streptomyces sp. AS58]
MPRWAVIRDAGQAESFTFGVYRELEGSEAEAHSAMLRIIDEYGHAHTASGRRRQRRQVYRISERSYLLRCHNRMFTDETVFTLAELIADTRDQEFPDSLYGWISPGSD